MEILTDPVRCRTYLGDEATLLIFGSGYKVLRRLSNNSWEQIHRTFNRSFALSNFSETTLFSFRCFLVEYPSIPKRAIPIAMMGIR